MPAENLGKAHTNIPEACMAWARNAQTRFRNGSKRRSLVTARSITWPSPKEKRPTNSLSSARSKTRRPLAHSSLSCQIRQFLQSRPSLSSNVWLRVCANWHFSILVLKSHLQTSVPIRRRKKLFLQTRYRRIRKAAWREQTSSASQADRDLTTAR